MAIANIGAILASNVKIGGNARETDVAKAWLAKHVNDWDRVEFNVGLGPGITLPAGTPDWVQKSATDSTKMRADMIAYRGDYAAIIECKGRIGPSALGQLLTYWHLLTADNPKLIQVYKIVAGQTIQDGLAPILHHSGVEIELFPGTIVPGSPNS